MKYLILVLSLISCSYSYSQSQIPDLVIPIQFTFQLGGGPINMQVGLDSSATDCLDPQLGESQLPPIPPPGWEAVITLPYPPCQGIDFTPSWHVVRELMLESLKRRGDFCWHCHTGIYAGVIHIAIKFEIPLLFWGESIAEYHSWYSYEEKEEVDEKRFNRAMNQGITADDMYEFLQGRVEKRDLWMFAYPSRKDVQKLKLRSICLGSYIKWDTKKQVEIIKKEFGWEGQLVEGVMPGYDYEKIECQFQGIRDFAKYIKRGYGRSNHLASIDIRNGRLSRENGLKLAQEYDGKKPASLPLFLEKLDLTEEEFYDILSKHSVRPWVFDPTDLETGNPLPDMQEWDRTIVDKPVGPPKDNNGKAETYI